MTNIPECPECDKIIAVHDKSLILSEFMDWLNANGYSVCTLEHIDDYYPRKQWIPIRKPYEQLFADFFRIDLKKVEAEKQALLKAIRTP